MFGPPGILEAAAKGSFDKSSDSNDVCKQYGLFPRSVIAVFERVKELNRTDPNHQYILSCGAIELSICGNEDMFTRSSKKQDEKMSWTGLAKGILIDDSSVPPAVRGHRAFIVETAQDIRHIFGVLATRNTQSTKLNDSSSRSHCVAWLYLHRYDMDKGMLPLSVCQQPLGSTDF